MKKIKIILNHEMKCKFWEFFVFGLIESSIGYGLGTLFS